MRQEMSNAVTERSLADLEAVIERGLETFVEVGHALLEIRDRRLYRKTHGTFEEYCKDRWKWSRQRSHQLIEAAVTVEHLSTTVDKPENEWQIRPLTKLPPDERSEAWAAAVTANGGQPTAKQVWSEVMRRVKAALPTAAPRNWEREREAKELRAEMRENSIRNAELFDVVDAVDLLAAPKRGMDEVAEWLENYDSPDKDWRGKVPAAIKTLTKLSREINLRR